MPGLFGIFEMGRRSLLSYTAGMNTVGHNVANANSPGYHRQRVELRPSRPEVNALGALGTGVTIASIHRIENRFIDLAVQREAPVLARYSARADVLSQTELIFAEPSDSGITTVLDQFFDAWDDLASNPEDGAARESVVRLGTALAGSIRTARQRLTDQQSDLSGEVHRTVDDANRVLEELRRLNRATERTTPENLPPDIEDRRDELVNQLGELVGASATIEDDGSATVRIGGRVVLQGGAHEPVRLEVRPGGEIAPKAGSPFTEHELGGRAAGLIQVRDGELAETLRRLDEFVVRLAGDVNALHRQGFDFHGRPAGAFFAIELPGGDGTTGSAAVLEVDPALRDDATLVAAGSGPETGSNGVALDIAALREDPAGIGGILRSLVVGVGSSAREAGDLASAQELVVTSFRAQQESVSGVSLDEEAADLMKFQRAYQAAARVLTVADEMAQTVLAI